jgi:outer membrane protein assembly factor BamA
MALLRLYLARGHVYARVEARPDVDRERHVAAVRFVVEEGPQVRLGRIVLTGARRTREEVVRRALAVAEGDVYDPEAIVRSQSALLRLGVFRAVGLRLREPDVPQETKDLSVELSERPWQTISQSLGYSIANGPRAMIEYEQPNLAGRALDLVARAKVNYPVETPFSVPRPDLAGKAAAERIEGRAEVGVRQPRPEAMPLPAGYHADLVAERLLRRAYHLGRASGIAGLDLGVTDRVSFSLQYELEVDRLDRPKSFAGFLTVADQAILRFDEGITTLQSLRPTLTLDFRDNSVHPHRGWFASGTLEYGHSIDGNAWVLPRSQVHTNMVRVWGTLSGYMPFGRSTVLALSLRGGRVFALDPDSRTIGPKRFFLGGANTMRGFAEDEMIQEDVRPLLGADARHCASSLTGIGCTATGQALASGKIPVSEGGTVYVLAKGEIRIALGGSLEAAIFVDLGNLWLLPENFRLTDLRPNIGTGLRFVTPIGPVAFDVGFNPVADRLINERIYALHFTVGLF